MTFTRLHEPLRRLRPAKPYYEEEDDPDLQWGSKSEGGKFATQIYCLNHSQPKSS